MNYYLVKMNTLLRISITQFWK